MCLTEVREASVMTVGRLVVGDPAGVVYLQVAGKISGLGQRVGVRFTRPVLSSMNICAGDSKERCYLWDPWS